MDNNFQCALCHQYLIYQDPHQSECGCVKYCSLECQKRHELTHFLNCENRNQELEFDLEYLAKPKSAGFKPLEFGIKDSLLYAVSQIVAHLPGVQELAFSEEWKTFYEGKYYTILKTDSNLNS